MSQINHATSLGIQRLFDIAGRAANLSREKLATGLRINRGSDDPAGLITSENLRAALKAIEAESRMLQRTSHVAQTADGALSEVSSMLAEANALLVAGANSTGMSPEEQQAIQMQLNSIVSSINTIAGSATFNGQNLLDGSMTLTAGGESVHIGSMAASALGAIEIDGQTYSLADVPNIDPEIAQQVVSAAMNQVHSMQGSLGAFQKHTVAGGLASLQVSFENLTAAESLLRDTDFAAETANLARLELLEKTSLHALINWHSSAESVLDLLA